MIVYIDVLLAVNIGLNGMILHFTAKFLGLRSSLLKIGLAAVVGSLYALGLLIKAAAVFYIFPWKVLLPLTVLMIAFGRMPWRKFILTAVVYHSISFFLGGIVLAYSYLTLSGSEILEYTGHPVLTVNYQQLLGGGICGCIILQTFTGRLPERFRKQKLYYKLKVIYENHQVDLTGLLDTGNSLYSMARHKPVILADLQAVQSLLDRECFRFLQNTSPGEWIRRMDQCPDAKWLSRVEVIPCRHVGGNSFLIGFRPNNIEVLTGDGWIAAAEAVIGICPGRLDRNQDYNAILHPAVLPHNVS